MKNITGIESSVFSQIAASNRKVSGIDTFEDGDTYDHEDICKQAFVATDKAIDKESCEENVSENNQENIIYSHLAILRDISRNAIGKSINQKI